MGFVRLIQNGLAGALVTSGASLVVLVFLYGLGGVALSFGMILLIVIAAGLIGGMIQGSLVMTSGALAGQIVAPTGDTTKYTATFSHIEALEIRGDLDGAEREWDVSCAANQESALVWVKAGDFHLRLLHDPAEARLRYEHVRDLRTAPDELVRYASQKLVDLHLGPLADEGRALVELRRLIDRFPATHEGVQARLVLAKLKAARHRDS